MSDSLDLDRYSRQIRFPGLGEEGQRRLLASRVTLCGCGALGSAIADGLVRAGVGFLRIVDRDFLELNNLQRQHLFDEDDLADHLPKAEAAARKLRRINSSVTIEAIVADFDHTNIHSLADDADLVLDGTDNFETRFLINDFSIQTGKPWVYGGCIGSQGQCMTIVPGLTPCFRCLVETAPPPGSTPTCESAGILSAISTIVANLQLAEAIKILSANVEKINRDLLVIDVWDVAVRKLKLSNLLERTDCVVCKQRRFDYLEGKAGVHTTSLCGRNAVQIVPPNRQPLDWELLRARLAPLGNLVVNRYLMQASIDGYQFSIFPDGRAIIKGTDDVSLAKSLYARYLGG
jgi:adenylyltransferase/sulfurtransferase